MFKNSVKAADPLRVVREIASSALRESFDSPYAALYTTAIRAGGDEISTLPAPDSSGPTYDFAVAHLVRNVVRKNVALPIADERRARALRAELACEAANRDTNRDLASRLASDAELTRLFGRVQIKIAKWLGSFDLEEWLGACRLGPGVNTGIQGTSDYDKLGQRPTVTPSFLPLAGAFLKEFAGWDYTRSRFREGSPLYPALIVYPGGKFSTAPKTALTDRPIETQPLLNAFAQRGIGMMLRTRLKRVGCDLTDQSLQQRRASVAQRLGLATVDFESASGLISRRLVEFALAAADPRWFHAMQVTRTARILIDGDWHELERFSAMGNGFTFELESLIFLALARALDGSATVYGDDVIIAVEHLQLFKRLAESCGLKVSPSKTFWTGPFRESCGHDYHHGTLVTPAYLKRDLDTVTSVIAAANALVLWHVRITGVPFDQDSVVFSAWRYLVGCLPKEVTRKVCRVAVDESLHDPRCWEARAVMQGLCLLSPSSRPGNVIAVKQTTWDLTSFAGAITQALYRSYTRTFRAPAEKRSPLGGQTSPWSSEPSPAGKQGFLVNYARDRFEVRWGARVGI